VNNLEYQEMSVNELVNALYEELELENPCIPMAEKLVLVEFMAWDIFHRGEYKPLFDSQKPNFTFKKSDWYFSNNTINFLIRENSPKNKEIVIY